MKKRRKGGRSREVGTRQGGKRKLEEKQTADLEHNSISTPDVTCSKVYKFADHTQDDKCKQDSEQAGTSTFSSRSSTVRTIGDYTQVGAALAIGEKGATVNVNISDAKIIMKNLSKPSSDTSRPHDEVSAVLSLAQSQSKVTRTAERSAINVEDLSHLNQYSNYRQNEDIEEVFEKAIDKWNKVLCNTQDNLIIRIEKLFVKGYKEIFSKMADNPNYFMRDKNSVVFEYTIERALAFKDALKRSIKPVSYCKLKKLILEATPKHLAIVGPAGSGKSTLLKRVIRDLSSDGNNEKLIIFLNFRDLHSENEITPCELLFQGLFKDESLLNDCYEWLLQNQERVIFLLDGLDQARWSVDSKAKLLREYSKGSALDIISNILSRRLFPNSKIVYSSREHSVSSLEDSLRPDKVISLTGFSYDDAKYLFTNAVKNGEDLWKKMEASVKALVTIPVFLIFTIFAYVCNPDSPPTSVTEVMRKLFDSFIRSKNVLNRDASGGIPITTLKGLQKLSFTGLCEKKLSFNIENFQNAELTLEEVRDFVIIVPGVDLPTFYVLEGDYVIFFSHQSIQEFFAAEYITQLDLASFKETVERYLRKDDWSVVTRFVSGILINEKSQLRNARISSLVEKQEIFKQMLASKYSEDQTTKTNEMPSTLSTLASIAETENSDFIQSSVKNIFFGNHSLGLSGISSIVSIMYYCCHLDNLQLTSCGLDTEGACFLWENVRRCSVTVKILNVSRNELGVGFKYICKIAAHCNVRELQAYFCRMRGNQLSCLKEMEKLQLQVLQLQGNDMSESSFSDVGAIIADGGDLVLPRISATNASGIQLLEKALGTKRLKGLQLCNATSKEFFEFFLAKVPSSDTETLNLSDTCFTSLGNIIDHGGSVSLEGIKANSSGMQRLKLALNTKKISKLEFSQCGIHSNALAVIGQIAFQSSFDELVMAKCKIDASGLDCMLKEAKNAKISKLDLSFSHIESTSVVGSTVKQCSIKNLDITDTDYTLDDCALRGLLSALNGVKISSLNLYHNKFNAASCEVIGNIVMQCSIDMLSLLKCNITDDALDSLLNAIKCAKLTKLHVGTNRLSPAAIQKIRECITVEDLDASRQIPKGR